MCNPHLFGDSIWFIFEFLCSYPKRWSVLVKAMPREKHLNRIYPWLLLFGLVICLKLCVLRILFLDVPLLVLKILNYFLAWPIKDLSMPTDDPINCDHFFDNWPFFLFSIYSLPGHISWYISSLSHIYYISKLWAPLKRKIRSFSHRSKKKKVSTSIISAASMAPKRPPTPSLIPTRRKAGLKRERVCSEKGHNQQPWEGEEVVRRHLPLQARWNCPVSTISQIKVLSILIQIKIIIAS